MFAEREILVSVLKLTAEGSAEIKKVIRDAKVPSQIACQILDRYELGGMIRISGSKVSAAPEQRLRIAIKAADLGADVERICKYLSWEEFEDISTLAFEMNGWTVKKHFRFSLNHRRFEIDLLASKRPFIVCADCKRWRRGWMGTASKRAAMEQIERTRLLAENSPKMIERMGITGWERACFIPLIISLFPSTSTFHEGSPIVPIIQLRSFIQDMPAYIDQIRHYWISINRIEPAKNKSKMYDEKI